MSTHDYGTAEVVSFSYDTLNRLSGATGAGWGESFTYDGFGNLTDKNVTSGSAPALHVTVNGANNRMNGYTYDANGNMTTPPSLTTASYDVGNRMTTASPPSGGTEYYVYGPDNQRVYKKKPDGTEELYMYGAFGERLGTYPFARTPSGLYGVYYIGAGTLKVYFAGRLVTTTLVDRLGSVRTTPYYPYGEEYTTTTENQEKFATYYRDGTTALDYARNRYYSSTLGRFLTADPYRASAGPGDPGSWNRYGYAANDPVNRNDPTGLDLEDRDSLTRPLRSIPT